MRPCRPAVSSPELQRTPISKMCALPGARMKKGVIAGITPSKNFFQNLFPQADNESPAESGWP